MLNGWLLSAKQFCCDSAKELETKKNLLHYFGNVGIFAELNLFHVVSSFSTCLDKHDVQFPSFLLAFFRGYFPDGWRNAGSIRTEYGDSGLPFVYQVGLITDEHYDHVTSSLGSDIVDPFRGLVE